MNYDIPSWLVNYAKFIINKHDFDSSHDLTHFENVYNYAKQIISEDFPKGTLMKGMSRENSIILALYAAYSHDIIDGKYVDSEKSIEMLRKVYIENGYNEEHLEILIYLINNMSYSKERTGKQIIPPELETLMMIIRDADKLDGFRIERIIAYHNRNFKDYKEPQKSLKINGWCKTILVKRIMKYKDEFLKTNCAKRLAIDMHDKVEKYVNENFKDVEMFDY